MAVAVQSHRDRGMAQAFLNRLRVRAVGDGKRDARVAEIVPTEITSTYLGPRLCP